MHTLVLGKEVSRLAKANAASSSIRATIPKRIVDELELNIGDIISWELSTEKGVKYARIKKLE